MSLYRSHPPTWCDACDKTTPRLKHGACVPCRRKAKAAGKPEKERKSPRRLRKSSLAALKRDLWSLISAYVKERDKGQCITCASTGLEGKNAHAGHMFPANIGTVLRFHPLNISLQCYHCNISLSGNGAIYAMRFIARYGMAQFEHLRSFVGKPHQWRAPELLEMISALKRGGADYELWYEERYGWKTTKFTGTPSAADVTIQGELTASAQNR